MYSFNRSLSLLLFRTPNLFNACTICENSFLAPLFPANIDPPNNRPLALRGHVTNASFKQ